MRVFQNLEDRVVVVRYELPIAGKMEEKKTLQHVRSSYSRLSSLHLQDDQSKKRDRLVEMAKATIAGTAKSVEETLDEFHLPTSAR